MKKIGSAYALWAGGVVSALVAAWLLYRSRLVTIDLEDAADDETID